MRRDFDRAEAASASFTEHCQLFRDLVGRTKGRDEFVVAGLTVQLAYLASQSVEQLRLCGRAGAEPAPDALHIDFTRFAHRLHPP